MTIVSARRVELAGHSKTAWTVRGSRQSYLVQPHSLLRFVSPRQRVSSSALRTRAVLDSEIAVREDLRSSDLLSAKVAKGCGIFQAAMIVIQP